MLQQAQTDRDNTKASDKRHFFFDTAAATLDTDETRADVRSTAPRSAQACSAWDFASSSALW